jgi:hypothetical protein
MITCFAEYFGILFPQVKGLRAYWRDAPRQPRLEGRPPALGTALPYGLTFTVLAQRDRAVAF